MKEISKLKQELAQANKLAKATKEKIIEAERQKAIDDKNNSIEYMIKHWEGQCFRTGSYEDHIDDVNVKITYYKKFFIQDNKLYVAKDVIDIVSDSYNRHYSYWTPLQHLFYHKSANIITTRTTEQLKGSDYRSPSTTPIYDSQFPVQITVEQFNELWDTIHESKLTVHKALSDIFPKR